MLNEDLEQKLIRFAQALVNQEQARVIVPAQQASSGFWFGGGNMIAGSDGALYLCGRYRNFGDSRTGVGAGERGLELAIFKSTDLGASWEKVLRFDKTDLNVGDREVLSIEGCALHRTTGTGGELFVSTEKAGIAYPEGLEAYHKPGTGVWTIERLEADHISELNNADISTVLETHDPRYLHIKDPFVYDFPDGGLALLFCTHPFSWSSSNTAYCTRAPGEAAFSDPDFDFFSRGATWDVAITRGTALIDVPRIGVFAEREVGLFFYDGGECLRNLDEHATAVKRPRGYSCEELGGVGYFVDGDFTRIKRLSVTAPMFVSPHGTGCSRYVDVLNAEGDFHVTWQQSQPDGSQPLVMNTVTKAEVENMLCD